MAVAPLSMAAVVQTAQKADIFVSKCLYGSMVVGTTSVEYLHPLVRTVLFSGQPSP